MNFKRWYISVILVIVAANAFSAKLNDAYEALRIHDYFKAKALYTQLNKKHVDAYASYGLSVIYYRNNNPFHSYDSAAKYANIAYNVFKQQNKTLSLSGFTIDANNIQSLIDSIASRQLQKSISANSIETYNNFLIQNYLSSPKYRTAAIAARDELEYNKIISINKSDSTHFFLITHPQSIFKSDGFKLQERQVFEEVTQNKSEESYIHFITHYAHNSNLNNAYRALLDLYKDNKNVKGIDAFIRNYPNAPQRTEAWQSLFTLTIKTFTKEELENFLVSYPDFPFKNSILKEVQLNALILIPVQKNDLVGFADTSGNMHIEPAYEEVSDFYEGLSIVHKNDSVYFINKENSNTLGRVFTDALPYVNGLAPVKINDKWFLIDRLGEIKTEAYDEINELSENSYIVKQKNLYGAIDPYGQTLYPVKYDKLGDFKNGCAYYQLDGLYGFITKNGYVHKPEFEWISDFGTNELAIYKTQNKFGLIKNNGIALTTASYDQIVKATDSIYMMVNNEQYGYFMARGCFLSEVAFDYEKEKKPSYYTNGNTLKLIKKGNEALMDMNGRMSIDFGVYTEINFASDGLIRIKKNNKYGYIDRKLNTVIACKYSSASDFEDSVAVVNSKKAYQLINTKGEELLSSEMPIERVAGKYFITEIDGHQNLYSRKGIVVVSNLISYEIYKRYLILYLHNNQIKIMAI